MNKKIYRLTITSMITAIYFVCCIIEQGFAMGPIQCRISEAFTLLPLFFPQAIIGVTLGCFIFNLTTGIVYDYVFGTLCTLSACIITYLIGKLIKNEKLKIILGGIPPVLINAIFIPLILIYGYKVEDGYPFLFFTILGGQIISVYIIGSLLYFPLKKVFIKFNLIEKKA